MLNGIVGLLEVHETSVQGMVNEVSKSKEMVDGGLARSETPSGGTWVMHTIARGIGLVYMILLERPPLLAQNLARICAGLLGQARCLQSLNLSFPSRFRSSRD